MQEDRVRRAERETRWPISTGTRRSDLPGLALLDRAPESEGIDLAAERLCRQDRVRAQMRHYGVDAVILSDPVNIR